MEQNLSSLKYIHISKSADTIVNYIDKRRKNEIRSLATPWRKFNEICMGGIEWNTITTIAGMSGSGKTAIQGQLETGLKHLNPKEDFAILSFGFEMLSSRMVGRKLSNRLKLTNLNTSKPKNHVLRYWEKEFKQIKPRKISVIIFTSLGSSAG